jgi:APA family basic amino acid/polyamine antiporter
VLGPLSAVTITVGGVIGSGIFLKPWLIAQELPSAGWVYACWALVGLTCLCGTFAYAELGCMFPEAGGQYAFLREAWGKFPAFLYGWCFFWVINTGTIAALAVAFANTVKSMLPMSGATHLSLSLGMIFLLALVNHFGVTWGAFVQNVSTLAKLLALGTIVVAGAFVAGSVQAGATAEAVPMPLTMTGVIASCVAIFWAYEGWHMLSFSAAEVRNPERNLPRGFVLGMGILIATYLLVNWTYLRVVSLDEMRAMPIDIDVPRAAVDRILGSTTASLLAVLVALSVFGATNNSLLSAPRAFYAMAKDRLLPAWLTRVHPTYRTPTTAIWSQAVWSGVLVIVMKEFRDITEYVIFAGLIFYGLSVAGVLRLRRSRPSAPRPYRCWGYPLTPLLFATVALLVDIYTLRDPESARNAQIGLAILATGVPAYFFTSRRTA